MSRSPIKSMTQKSKRKTAKEELETRIAENAIREQEIRTTLKESEETIHDTQRELATLDNDVTAVRQTFDDAGEAIRFAGWIVPVAIAILYAIYSWYVSLPLNALLFGELFIVPSLIAGLQFVAYLLKLKPNTVHTGRMSNTLERFRMIAGNLTSVTGSFVSGVKIVSEVREVIQKRQTFVRTLRNALTSYGFALNNKIESYLESFPSFSDKEEVWLDEVSNSLSKMMDTQAGILKVAYADYDKDDSSRKNEWSSIRAAPTALEQLITHLFDAKLLDIPLSYRESPKPSIEFISRQLATYLDFTLSKAQVTVSRAYQALDKEKGDFLRTLTLNKIALSEEDRDEFASLLPAQDAHPSFLVWLERRTKVQSYVLQLFFLDYRGLERERDEHFAKLKQNKNDIATLSSELLTRKIVSLIEPDEKRKGKDIVNLAHYLDTISAYDRVEISSTFSRYSRLFETSKSILEFLKDQGICRKEADVLFESVLTLVPPATDFLLQLEAATRSSILKFSSSGFATEWLQPVALAAMTVFLVDSEDLLLRSDICRRVANVERAVKILYEYSWTNEEEQDKSSADRTSLERIIRRSIDGEWHSEVYLPEFTHSLVAGKLCKRIKEIPNTVFRDADQLVSSLSEVKTKLEKHVSALTTVLETQLDNETIIESLKMQLVGAYAITVPTHVDVLSSIIDRLPEVCKELETTDPMYAGLFLPSEAEDKSFGSHTRIGLVPFRMDFTEFTRLFETAYRTIVRRRELANQLSYPAERYLANITRIFPTSAYFKQLAVESENRGGDNPLTNILKSRMIEKFGGVRTLEVLASLKQTDKGRVAMRSMLANLYDETSRIYLIDRERFDGVLSGSKLGGYLREGNLDKDLLEKFGRKKLSELAVMVHRSGEPMLENLKKHVADICLEIRAGTHVDEIQAVSRIMFDALTDVGLILDRLGAKVA